MGKLRKRRIIETFIAFVAGGVAAVEFVYHILVHNYHFPKYTTDITIAVIVLAMLCTLAWRWFRGEREEGTEEPKTEPISFPEWKKSIVVLPFDNISPEEGQDYFCDGMTEEIITDLSGVHDLRVISRSSAMMLKGSKRVVRNIAKELNVQYVLEGSVRKVGNDLRISAQLIDATSDAHLWAEKYSGTLDDVFNIQENVSRSIVDAIKLKLSPEESKKIAERPIDNVQAYECYLRARRDMSRLTEEGLGHALRDLQNGFEIIGENALIYVGLAIVYILYYETGITADEETLQKAEEFANKVLKLKPNSSSSHYLLGAIERFRGSPLKAIKHFKQALAVDPDCVDALLWLSGSYAFHAGKPSAAEPLIKRLIEIDPLTPVNFLFLGLIQFMGGQLDQALSSFRKMEKLEPESIFPKFWCIYVLAWKSQYDKAFELIDQIIKDKSHDMAHKIFAEWCLFFKYALQGEKTRALETISEDVKMYFWNDPELPWLGACNYALINEKEEALNWLEHAIDRGWINYPLFAEKDPFLENIRGEERFKKLMERVKYAWENFEV